MSPIGNAAEVAKFAFVLANASVHAFFDQILAAGRLSGTKGPKLRRMTLAGF
jgi:hypothetical protein